MKPHPVRHLVSDQQLRSANPVWLITIKAAHTIVWAVFVACIVAIPLAAWRGEHHAASWLTVVVAVEVLVSAFNGWRCPMTSVAARFTDRRNDNSNIYLPLWLAKQDKLRFGELYVVGVLFAFVQWVRASG